MFANKWGYQRCHYKWLPCRVVWLPTVNTEKELPSFLLKRRNWACLIKNAVHHWVSGVLDVGLMASKDSHAAVELTRLLLGQPSFQSTQALLASIPQSQQFSTPRLSVVIMDLAQSWPLPAQRIATIIALRCHHLCAMWNVVLLSLLLLIHPQNLRGWGRWR